MTITASDLDSEQITINATVANGQTTSPSIDIAGFLPIGILIPVALTSATFRIQVSVDNVTFVPIYDPTGIIYNITNPAAAGYLPLSLMIGSAVGYASTPLGILPRFIRIVTASAEGASRVFTFVLVPDNRRKP